MDAGDGESIFLGLLIESPVVDVQAELGRFAWGNSVITLLREHLRAREMGFNDAGGEGVQGNEEEEQPRKAEEG